MSPGRGRAPVDCSIRFERFPATVKGALVLRGADAVPHLVRLESLEIARIPSGTARPAPAEAVSVDVAPGRDLFVPFEAPITELAPGWYAVRATLLVDGEERWRPESRPFAVPWPRGAMRRGRVELGATLRLPGGSVASIDRVELGGEWAMVQWRLLDAGSDEAAQAVLLADGERLQELPERAAPAPRSADGAEARRSVCYPVPRGTADLLVTVRSAGGEEAASVEVPLG